MSTLGLLEIKLFWNKGYEVIISAHDVITNFITRLKLYCTCGHVTKVLYSSISVREVIITLILWGFDHCQWFGTGTRCALETLHQCGKKSETKCQKVLVANSSVCRSYRDKVLGGLLGPPVHNRVVIEPIKNRERKRLQSFS